MAGPMVRKHVYLEPEQDSKLKRLAALHGCTEAQVMRQAIQRLPDPEGDALSRLAAAG